MKFLYYKFRNLRSKILLAFFKSVYGKSFNYSKGDYVRKGFSVVIEENGEINIGKNVFFNNYCSLNALEKIEIGDDCIFGENVHIYDHNHIYEDEKTPINSQGFKKNAIIIGQNCWVGSNVIILQGVKIGRHSVIGANCVIYKDLPDNSIIVAGKEN